MFVLRTFVVWLVLIGVATILGNLLPLIVVPGVGYFPPRHVSVVTVSLLTFTVAYLVHRWIGATTSLQLFAVGLMWGVLTVMLDIGLGRLVLHVSWQRIAEELNILRGGLLSVRLLAMLLTPLLAATLRNRLSPQC